MSEFTDVKTVQDLINLNAEGNPEELYNQIIDMGPQFGLELTIKILQALKAFHAGAIDGFVKDDMADHSAQWACDFARIEVAIECIREIQL